MAFGIAQRSLLSMVFASLLASLVGCASLHHRPMAQLHDESVPRELNKVNLFDYIVEPPDILIIQATHTLRRPDSQLAPGDRLQVKLKNGLPIDVAADAATSPAQFDAELQIEMGFKVIAGTYRVETSGSLDFGPSYGKVRVVNMTVAQAEQAIKEHLEKSIGIKDPELSVELEDLESPQAISGEHLVRPDGRVSLGVYGEVFVSGMSLDEVRTAVIDHLAANGVQDPKVAVDVSAYNSKAFYIISDGGGFGEQVARLPYTGNETVLDAISQINGLAEVSSKRIWVARPVPAGECGAQILDVEWEDITAMGQTTTNFQLMPGDRIYIKADPWVALNNRVEKLVAPIERVLGVSLLGFSFLRNTKAIYPISSQGGGGGFN